MEKLLDAINQKVSSQFRYNEEENLKRGIALPEDSVEHAIQHGLVHAISAHYKWSCYHAIEFAVAILEDSNCHSEAKVLADFASGSEAGHDESKSAISGDNF